MRTYAVNFRRGQLLVTSLLLQAIARSDLLQPDQAQGHLLEALTLGCRLGLVRSFLDEGKALLRMLTALADKPQTAESGTYLAKLLECFEPGDACRVSEAPTNDGPSMLTPRELAILQLISQAMSNKRVALTLNISMETVKWNLKNIYSKMGVFSRYDAVSWARKHDLIE
ncbi:HTH-type transcriptional regulator AlkS [compost metagenome]